MKSNPLQDLCNSNLLLFSPGIGSTAGAFFIIYFMSDTEIRTRSYDIQDALKYGIEEAIFLNNIKHWIAKNKANNRNYYDGYYWTYNSAKAYSKLFPEFNESKIKRIMKSLIEQGAIITGNYNKQKFDRTQWIAIPCNNAKYENEQCIVHKCTMDSPEMNNGKSGNGLTIPDIKPDIITDNNNNNKSQNQNLKSWEEMKQEHGIMTMKELIQEAVDDQIFLERQCMQHPEKKLTVELMKCYIIAIYSYWKKDIKVQHTNRTDLRRHLINTIKKDIQGDNYLYKEALLIQKQKQNK